MTLGHAPGVGRVGHDDLEGPPAIVLPGREEVRQRVVVDSRGLHGKPGGVILGGEPPEVFQACMVVAEDIVLLEF